MSQILANKFASIRRRQTIVCAATAVSAVVGAAIALLAIQMFFDWLIELPLWVRTILLAFDGIVLLGLAFWGLYPVLFAADDESVALWVEHIVPEFSSRLIASIQLSQPGAVPAGASVGMVKAMIRQTEEMAAPLDFTRVVRTETLVRLAGGAVLGLVLGFGLYAYGNEDHVTGDLLERALLANIAVPRHTRVDLVNPDFKVARGDAALLQAKARGIAPNAGKVKVVYDSGRTQTYTMDRDKDDRRLYARSVEAVQESFQYTVYLNDGHSETHRIEALARPDVESVQCTQIYPAYTGLPQKNRAPGDLALLVGSKLQLTIKSSKPLVMPGDPNADQSEVRLQGSDDKKFPLHFPLKVDPVNPTQATAAVNLPPNSNGFCIALVDQDGLKSKDPVVYRFDLIPDQPPKVEITSNPSKLEVVTAVATMNIAWTASDDFGVARVWLYYKVDEGDVKKIPLEMSPARQVVGSYVWDLAKLPIATTATQPTLEKSTIEYWLAAEDNDDTPGIGPNHVEGDHYQLHVVTPEEKLQEILTRRTELLDQMREETDKQEQLSGTLRDSLTGRTKNATTKP